MSDSPSSLLRHALGCAYLSLLFVACGGSGGSGNSGPIVPPGDTPPTAAINAPTLGVAALRGDTVAITFTANDDGAGLARLIVSVDASLATTGDNTQVFGPEADANGVAVTRNAVTTGLAAGVYTLFLTVDDGVNPVVSAVLGGPFVLMQGHAGVAPTRSTAFGVRGARVLMSIGETEDAAVPVPLNGDLDTGDGVLATQDTTTAAFTQHALSTDVTGINGLGTARKLDNDGGQLFFQVREADQGFLNADLDNADTLFGWWDAAAPAAFFHNYGGVFSTGRAFGAKALVAIDESEEGGAASLNIDADTIDTIGATIDISAPGGTRFVIPRATVANPVLALDGAFAAYKISEANNGGNMSVPVDGDATDNFIFVANVATNTFVGLAGSIAAPGVPQAARDTQVAAAFDVSPTSRVVYYVNEVTAGVDLNGDGDAFDNVPSLWNPTGIPFVETFPGPGLQSGNNPRIAAYLGSRLFYTSMENRTVGAFDDNGDGDGGLDQEVLRWTDDGGPAASTVLAPGLAGFPGLTGLALDGGFLAEVGTNFLSVVVQEAANGFLDLSGDGNIGPALLLIDTSTPVPTVFNTSLSPMVSPPPGLIPITGVKGPLGLAVLVSETVNGNLNGDADATDTLLLYLSFGAPTVPVNLGSSAAVDVHLAGLRIGIIANEQTNLTDYNLDGDNLDMVFRAFTTAGLPEQVGLTAAPTARVAADDGTLWAFLRSEVAEVRDLNGDGDQLDVVVGFWKP